MLRETQIVYGRHLNAGVPLSDVSPREHLFSPEGGVRECILHMEVSAFPGKASLVIIPVTSDCSEVVYRHRRAEARPGCFSSIVGEQPYLINVLYPVFYLTKEGSKHHQSFFFFFQMFRMYVFGGWDRR